MKSPFPASYSTLCPNALASLISDKYESGRIDCRLLMRGVGDTYLVESPDKRYILRVYRSAHRSLPQIKEEARLLAALKQAGVSVSYPIRDTSGGMILEIAAIEGMRYAVLFSYAPGETVRILNENQLRALGREMARFHHVSSIVPLGDQRWNFDLQTTVIKPLELIKPAFAGDAVNYRWLLAMADEAKRKLSGFNASAFSKGYCHFDFLPKNFHFVEDSLTFFDFDFMGYGWLVNDLMSFWQHLMMDAYTGRMTKAAADDAYRIFLEGYREVRAVTAQELEAVPYLSLGFWLFYMGFHTTHDQFYAYTQPAHVKSYTVFLRYIVENHWIIKI